MELNTTGSEPTITFTPKEPGEYYFMTPTLCKAGLRVAVSVSAASPVKPIPSGQAKRERKLQWMEHVASENKRLDEEQDKHGDMLLLQDLVDTYR